MSHRVGLVFRSRCRMGSHVDAPLLAADRESGPFAPLRPLPPLPAAWRSLPRAFVVQARSRWTSEAMADSTGARLTYGKTLISALALGRALARTWGPANHVGLLVPPTVPAAVAN